MFGKRSQGFKIEVSVKKQKSKFQVMKRLASIKKHVESQYSASIYKKRNTFIIIASLREQSNCKDYKERFTQGIWFCGKKSLV